LPSQVTAEPEAPPKERQPQESHADEAAEDQDPEARPSLRKGKSTSRTAVRRRQHAFAKAYSCPGTSAYLNATKASIAAGYAKSAAATVGCKLLKNTTVRQLITAFSAETAEKMAAETAVSCEYVKQQHLQQMHECRAVSDRTNAREHLEDLGRMVGAYDVGLHVDLTVKHEYDERIAIEASRLARLALEEMGDRALGLPCPAIEIQGAGGDSEEHTIDPITSSALPAQPDDPQDMLRKANAAPVVESVGVEGVRPAEGSLVASGDGDGHTHE